MSARGRRRPAVSPSASRERALGLLYEAEMKHVTPRRVLAGLPVPPDELTGAIVEGVDDQADRIDDLVQRAAIGWDLRRMTAVDRAVLRMATWELLARPEVPVAVIIDEAVELAKRFSTEQSGPFVNGVLSTVARTARG